MRFRTYGDVNYDEIVSLNYRMNPETEDVIYGDELEDGMIVLAVSTYRQDENHPILTNSEKLLEANRWCIVSKLRKQLEVIEIPNQDIDDVLIDGTKDVVVTKRVYFIGRYSDGSKQVRSSGPEQGWIVKTDKKTLNEVTADVVEANQAKREPDTTGV